MAKLNRSNSRKPGSVVRSDPGIPPVVPLGGGTFVYLRMPETMKTMHLSTSSSELDETLRGLVAGGYGDRFHGAFAALAEDYPGTKWVEVAARLEADGIWDPQEEDVTA